jgi:hypothetical protein
MVRRASLSGKPSEGWWSGWWLPRTRARNAVFFVEIEGTLAAFLSADEATG